MTLTGTCDCGAVSVTVPSRPDRINACPCDYCRRVGARWGYYDEGQAVITGQTHRYDRATRSVDFHRCARCGTLTHWIGKTPGRIPHMGVHMENFDPADLEEIPVVIDP